MTQFTFWCTIFSFVFTMVLIFWRPKGINEAIPATIGAILIFLCGSVSLADIADIGSKVTGAALTIMATLVMAIALESIGFFHWVTAKLLEATKGSGLRLFWLSNILCFLMTLFLNNDGSILITTPILLMLLKQIGLNNKQKLPYLISGALIATASSAPIGVSNIVNLIALKIIGMDLYLHTIMMFVPGTLGLLFLSTLLYLTLYKKLPKQIPLFYKPVDYSQLITLPSLESQQSRHFKKTNKGNVLRPHVYFLGQNRFVCRLLYGYLCFPCCSSKLNYSFSMALAFCENKPVRFIKKDTLAHFYFCVHDVCHRLWFTKYWLNRSPSQLPQTNGFR